MAARTEWAGMICLAPGTPFAPVEAMGTTGKEPSSPIKDLCSHCSKPLDRSHRCPETMQAPAGKVKGVERPDGSFAVISEAEAQALKLESDQFTPLACEPLDGVPIELCGTTYDLRAPKKQPGFVTYLAALARWLEDHNAALIGQIVQRQKQQVVAVYVKNGKVRMSKLPTVVRQSEPDVLAAVQASAAVDGAYLQMLDTIMGKLPTHVDLSQVENEGKKRIEEAVARVLSGAVSAEPTPAAPEEVATPDLLGDLKRAMGGEKPDKKPAPTPTKKAEEVKA